MSLSKKINLEDELDLREIILSLWKEKFLIFTVTLIFTVAGYVYSVNQIKIYQISFTIRQAPYSIFDEYMQYLPDRYSNKQYIKRFDEEFRLNLLSIDNLISFIERDKDLLEFRSYLKENNIDTKAYFKNKLIAQNYKKNNIKYIYTLTFSKPLDGEEFFENYVIFTKNVTEDIFKDELYKILINQIKFYNENLLIAKKINSDELYKNSIPPNDRQFLFYKGTQVLSLKIDNLKQFLNYIKEKSLDYDPIVEKASPKQISKSTIILTFLSFISGLIFIIFFIGFKNFLRNKQ